MEQILRSWSGLASHFIGECFDLARPFIGDEFDGLDPLVRFVSAQLYIDCHLSSESVLLLIREQKEWDADLLTRSVMEGSIKLTYMLHGTSADTQRKADEYWNILPQFSAIKHSDRARRFLADARDPDNPNWNPFRDLVMDESEISAIRAKYSRQQRKALEECWSFTGICRWFAHSQEPSLRGLVHLAHGYGMSSHLLHKDGDGIGIVWERYLREPEHQSAAKLGHAARIVSDICSFAQLRLFSLLRACRQSTNSIAEIEQRYATMLFSELAKAGARFTETEYGERA